MKNTETLLEEIISILESSDKTKLKTLLSEAIQSAVASELESAKREKAFHKRLNEDMLSGLHSIYKEISQVTVKNAGDAPQNATEATEIFHEASRQLEEIMQTTLEAADSIMNNAEVLQANQEQVSALVESLSSCQSGENAPLAKFEELAKDNINAINEIVIALSFQDLTGQRIKKVVNALSSIHQIVVQTYVSAGLMLKKSEEEQNQDFDTLAAASKEKASAITATGSELKGPTLDASQKDVDDLLAQLGF